MTSKTICQKHAVNTNSRAELSMGKCMQNFDARNTCARKYLWLFYFYFNFYKLKNKRKYNYCTHTVKINHPLRGGGGLAAPLDNPPPLSGWFNCMYSIFPFVF